MSDKIPLTRNAEPVRGKNVFLRASEKSVQSFTVNLKLFISELFEVGVAHHNGKGGKVSDSKREIKFDISFYDLGRASDFLNRVLPLAE